MVTTPAGNSLNCARLVDGRLTDHQILARGLQEAIALVRDADNRRMWITDLGGNVWEYSLSQGALYAVSPGWGR